MRRSTRVVAADRGGRARTLWAGVDVGGTGLRVVVADAKGRILVHEHAPTDRAAGPRGVIRQIAAGVERGASAAGATVRSLAGVGVGVAAAVDPGRGMVIHGPNLGWREVPLAARLETALGRPVAVGNDVDVAVLGEHAYGAARGASSVVGIWVGTGVGGGVILGGRLLVGARGSAGEIGHMVIDPSGPRCGCGNQGCLEALASRTALERTLAGEIAAGTSSLLPAILAEESADRITVPIIRRALLAGDELVGRALGRVQEVLAHAVVGLVNVLDPEVVVFGGGLSTLLGERFLGPIRTTARGRLLNRRRAGRVRIVLSRLRDHAGALGACVLARTSPRQGD